MNRIFRNLCLCVAVTLLLTACGNDEPFPSVPIPLPEGPSGNESAIVINNDGSTSTGARFVPVDDTAFFIDGLRYAVDDSHIVINGYDEYELPDNVRPYAYITYRGVKYPVTSIRTSFGDSKKVAARLLSFDTPATVETMYIPDKYGGVFFYCQSLCYVTLPDKLQKISKNLFYGCISLKRIHIPSSVTVIESEAFFGCESIPEIVFPDGLKFIGEGAFRFCNSVKEIDLPSGIESIDPYSFSACRNLAVVRCHIAVPPEIEYNVFEYHEELFNTVGEPYNKTLYVPEAAVAAYSAAYPWNYFREILPLP